MQRRGRRRVPSTAGQRVSPLRALNASRAAAPESPPFTCSRRSARSRRQREHPRRERPCLLPPRLFKLIASSLGSLYTPSSSHWHPLPSWSSHFPRKPSPPLLPVEDLGEGGTPVAPFFHSLLRLLPFASVVPNPLSISGCFDGSDVNSGFGVCGREHPSSSPAQVSAPPPDSLLCEHL